MRAILNALDEQHSELAALLDPLDDAGWQRPTRCEGWTVADVVLHLAQSDELAVASVQDRLPERLGLLAGGPDPQGDVDDGAAAMVAQERGAPTRPCSTGGGPALPRCARCSRRATRTNGSTGLLGECQRRHWRRHVTRSAGSTPATSPMVGCDAGTDGSS